MSIFVLSTDTLLRTQSLDHDGPLPDDKDDIDVLFELLAKDVIAFVDGPLTRCEITTDFESFIFFKSVVDDRVLRIEGPFESTMISGVIHLVESNIDM